MTLLKFFSKLISIFAVGIFCLTAFTGVGAVVGVPLSAYACPVAGYGGIATLGSGLLTSSDGNYANANNLSSTLQTNTNSLAQSFVCGEGKNYSECAGNLSANVLQILLARKIEERLKLPKVKCVSSLEVDWWEIKVEAGCTTAEALKSVFKEELGDIFDEAKFDKKYGNLSEAEFGGKLNEIYSNLDELKKLEEPVTKIGREAQNGISHNNKTARTEASQNKFVETKDYPDGSASEIRSSELVFKNGNKYISADNTAHNFDYAWKVFDSNGKRIGTAIFENGDLIIKKN